MLSSSSFSSVQSLNKIENIQKRALRFLLNDYNSNYEDLLEKSGYPNMNLRRQRTPCIEIHETLNKLNSCYKNDIFKLRNIDRLTRKKYKLNLEIPTPNQATFGTRILRSYGLKTWNAFPYHIKTSDNLNSFKFVIKCWGVYLLSKLLLSIKIIITKSISYLKSSKPIKSSIISRTFVIININIFN